MVGAGNASGSLDASNILKPALARGEIQCIGATTLDEYRKNIKQILQIAIDKGIIISDQSAALYSVVYDFADEQPFVDDYTGTEPLKDIAKRKMPPRIYDSKWKLKLIP